MASDAQESLVVLAYRQVFHDAANGLFEEVNVCIQYISREHLCLAGFKRRRKGANPTKIYTANAIFPLTTPTFRRKAMH